MQKHEHANPLSVQVGGDHYRKLKIQPVEYIHANGIPFIEGCIIKYATRWRDKGGTKDLEKIKHFVDLLLNLEAGGAQPEPVQEWKQTWNPWNPTLEASPLNGPPVPSTQCVDVMLRRGDILYNKCADRLMWTWTEGRDGLDIVSWRVSQDPAPER